MATFELLPDTHDIIQLLVANPGLTTFEIAEELDVHSCYRLNSKMNQLRRRGKVVETDDLFCPTNKWKAIL